MFKGTQNVTASVRVKISPGTPPTVQIKKPRDGIEPVIRVRIKSSRSGTTSFNCEGVVEEGEYLSSIYVWSSHSAYEKSLL